MRGATGVTIQPHQILRLSRRKTHILSPHHIWNLIYKAGRNRCHHPTSPNTAPATQNDSHAWSSSHMKRHLQCAEQQVSPSNLTKYCACHTEWLACLIVVTYETSFTMRGATGVTIQPHQIPRLPHKMTRMLDRRHIWNLISNARSNRYHDPTSPNTAPATKNDTARFQRKSPKTGETSFPMRGRSDHDPSMIRPWSENENANRNPPRNRGYFSTSPRAFSIVKYNVSRPILHSNLHQVLRLPRKVTLERHQVLRLPRKVTLERHQVLRLPTRLYLTLLYLTLLDSTWLYSTLLDSAWLCLTRLDSTWLYLTLLDSTWFYLTLVDSTLLDSTWLYLTLLDTTLLDSTWLYLTLLDSAWLCLTLLDSTWLYLTLLDSTWLYLTLLYSTLLDSTLLDSTWHYSTWLYLTLTWLGCRSYIGSFSAKLPLISKNDIINVQNITPPFKYYYIVCIYMYIL